MNKKYKICIRIKFYKLNIMNAEVKDEVKKTIKKQNIQLVDGEFTVSEANDIVKNLINEKINFHKLQRLSLCEGFSKSNTEFPDSRIGQLQNDKKISNEFFRDQFGKNVTVTINGVLEITINE